jgi:SAM-dependent methyltransferase
MQLPATVDRVADAVAYQLRRTASRLSATPRTDAATLDARIAGLPFDEARRAFLGLDDATWARLLYTDHPHENIRAFLPRMPPAELQEQWVGYSGERHLELTAPFGQLIRSLLAPGATVCDYGVGFGRHIRWLLRDLPRERLCAVDPHGPILRTCRDLRIDVFADLAQIDYWPEANPFGRRFDVVYSYSVLTHLEEEHHLHVLGYLAKLVRRGGTCVVTVFERGLWQNDPEMLARFDEKGYAFRAFPPHPDFPARHAWGNTAIGERYIQQRWRRDFEIVGREQLPDSQIAVRLRRR